jgi:simple sugar transport system permease protein
LLPALARAYLKVNEIITTLMLNFVAALWLAYWTTGPWEVPTSVSGMLSTKQIPVGADLHQFTLGSTTIGLGIVLAVLAVAAVAAAFRYFRFGYTATLASGEEATARYAGVRQRIIVLWGFLASGAIGGLAGAVMELDQVHSYSTALTNNTGYIGIVIAVLAGTSLVGVIPVAILMGAVVAAGNGLQIAGISSDLVLFVTGVLLLFAGAADVLARYRVRFRAPPRPAAPRPELSDTVKPLITDTAASDMDWSS